jgi:hypothetical protein
MLYGWKVSLRQPKWNTIQKRVSRFVQSKRRFDLAIHFAEKVQSVSLAHFTLYEAFPESEQISANMAEEFTSPIPATLDKLGESSFFLSQMMRSYHSPTEFRYNLNAFIQALRNITFMLQSEERKPEGFEEWYAGKQVEMKSNKLLRKFILARNLIVKQGMLAAKSTAHVGIFRGRSFKMGVERFPLSWTLFPFLKGERVLYWLYAR